MQRLWQAMVTADALKSVPLLAELPDERLAVLASAISVCRVQRGRFILHAGEKTAGFYIIRSGRAKVLLSNEEASEVTLAIIGPGDYFGEMGLLDDHPHSASVQTLATCELMHITAVDFLRCFSDNPGFATCIMRGLIRRLRQANRQIESLALLDVYGRVARVLLDLSENIDGDRVIQKVPSQQELARMVGASRETVSRVLRDLQNSGHIWVERRRTVHLEKALIERHALSGLSAAGLTRINKRSIRRRNTVGK
jgi:CRP/FNR family cyclic AMP-dependent transcriptional regulator